MKTILSNRRSRASRQSSSGLRTAAAWTTALLLLATANIRAGVQNGVVVSSVCGGGVGPPFNGYVEGNPNNGVVAKFNYPAGLAIDSAQEYLFVADYSNSRIRAVELGSIPPSVTNHDYFTYTFAPIPGLTDGTISNPVGVALDADDNVYVLNRGNGKNGKLVMFDEYGYWYTNLASGLTNANALALDGTGNVYVTASNYLFKITSAGDKTTVTNVPGANLQGLVVMGGGRVAVCDSAQNGIWLINATNGVTNVLTGFNGTGDNNNIWTNTPNAPVTKAYAKFNQPMGLAKAGNNMLIVTDYGNNRVKAVDALGTVTNLYGVTSSLWLPSPPGLWPGWEDGKVSVPDAVGDVEARLPNGVLFAPDGTVYVTEDYYHLIRKVTGANLPPAPPPAPTITTVSTNYGQVTLTWSASPGATGYNVKRSTSGGGPYTTIATNVTGLSYTDTTVINGRTYYYVVSAVGPGGEGPDSAPVSATPPLPPVPDPQIGYVDFPQPNYVSVFHPFSSFIAYNDTDLVIKGTPGSSTWYTYGYTTNAATVDDPPTNSASIPSDYQDGLYPNQVQPYVVPQEAPYLTIKALGTKSDGSPNSAVVAATIQFVTGNPNIIGNNFYNFTIGEITTNAILFYTLDGTNWVDLSTTATLAGNVWSVQMNSLIQTNTLFQVQAFRDNYQPSAIVNTWFWPSNAITTRITPNSGYYPMGQTITVLSPNTRVYYTGDGTEPTTNSLPVTITNSLGYIRWFNSTNDLTALRVKAFSAGGVTRTVTGQPATTNTIGVPPDFNPTLYAGIGAQIVVPVVANLQPNVTIKSYQFRVEVSPNAGARPITNGFNALNVTTNDFVPLASVAPSGTTGYITVQPYALGSTNGLEVYAVGNTNNVSFQNYAVVALLQIPIPASASEGDSYTLAVRWASATADGASDAVPLTLIPAATILVTNVAYTVGDSASASGGWSFSGGWYNAGGFGNGDLDNSDVNLAFDAALGWHAPYIFSDAYNAMDAYPVDASGFVGGDGMIRFLDWNVILQRSLRMDSNNWARLWSVDGNLTNVSTTLPSAKSMVKESEPKLVSLWPWYRQAVVGAVSAGNAFPGAMVSVPVYVKLANEATLSGLQFRAAVTPQGGAPALSQAPQFSTAPGVPGPNLQQSFTASDAGFGWALGSLNYPSGSSNLLGWVTFNIPPSARSGQTYSVCFPNADGAPDMSAQYEFETRTAYVTVGGPAPQASICSDEWKIYFFGILTSPSAGDLADADGDGVPNWMEYLAGTDPTDPNSRLTLKGPTRPAGKGLSPMALSWLTAPGKAYQLQWSSKLAGAPWNTLANVSGDGTVASVSDTNPSATVRYYRLLVLP